MATKLDEALVKEIAKQVELVGEWPERVARRSGVTSATWRAWWVAGTDHEDADPQTLTDHQRLCVALVDAIRKAESVVQRFWLRKWLASASDPKARTGMWQPWATLLERRFPEEWRKREMVATQKPGEQTIEDEFRKMSAEEARKALEG